MACSLADEVEVDLVEALLHAADGLEGIGLRLRKHPLSALEQHPRLRHLPPTAKWSSLPLLQDVAEADLIVFTYSTVAAEAFVCGKPAWMWQPLGFDASALGDVVNIPRFTTVAQLRESLVAFERDPAVFTPAANDVVEATWALFGPADGREGWRIAEQIRLVRDATIAAPARLESQESAWSRERPVV